MDEQTFEWMCPSEGCRYVNREILNELGPVLALTCGDCDQWFGEKDLRPEDAAKWNQARIDQLEYQRITKS